MRHATTPPAKPASAWVNDAAARLVHHGVGVRLPPRASASRIAKAVEDVLTNDRFRSNAVRLSSAIADVGQTADLVPELEALAGHDVGPADG
jgi:UDP:flavonoid glycosyltransferase YjiC (YdhE family)